MRDLAYIALGSNLGPREQHLAAARAAIAKLPNTRLLAASEIEETAPIGPAGQGPYLNQMVVAETELEPHQLLAELQRIERENGRERGTRWGPRTLDLDIVRFARQTVADDELTVPHPALAERDFWKREIEELRGAESA